jgi:hypothetical protein
MMDEDYKKINMKCNIDDKIMHAMDSYITLGVY